MAEEVKKSSIAQREEKILEFWKRERIFYKTLEKKSPKGDFVFYDGPPFATGLPHYGHVLPGTMKDVLPRYKTMRGYHVQRRWGWDCHGLPIETLVEKELGLKTKKDIEVYGIEKFNTAARNTVFRYRDEWKRIIPRLGRFVDMENDYRTLDPSYTESVWWSWKQLYDKGLAYESFKTMQVCPRCGTTLSNFEVNQGYKDITDISVYVKCAFKTKPNTYFLAWTTTPWTLPGNVALAVGKDIEYVTVEKEGLRYIVAKALAQKVFKENYTVVSEMKGKDLIGEAYEPIFNYYNKSVFLSSLTTKQKERIWHVVSADFVTTEDGTGIVHIAPGFGDDDYQLAQKEGLPMIQHVRDDGMFKPEITDFAGLLVKPKEDHQKTDIEIIKHLAHHGSLFAKEKIIHSYPHCWRCETPLLNFATSSWFVKVTALKDALIKENKKVCWTPEDIGQGRFGKWLEGARDWAVSRTRYWGASMPIWRSEDGKEIEVLGSINELKQKTSRGNTFFLVRHGQGQHNIENVLSSQVSNAHHLTEQGKKEVHATARKLKKKSIDIIYASPFIRGRETAQIIAAELGIDPQDIVYDKRLGEISFGNLEGKSTSLYHSLFKTRREIFENAIPGGESFNDVRARVGEFLYEKNDAHESQNILVVSHETPIWLMEGVSNGHTADQITAVRAHDEYLRTGGVIELPFAALPHNRFYEIDLHRPYIDQITWKSKRGQTMRRVPDVFDTWYDSGSMPFAQSHYPFSKKKQFPADFIAEGLDQTRGWFYTLLVLSTALFGKSPYRNVVVNGLILAEDGKKMSKSLKNYPELEPTINRYGADALRYYLMASPAVKAEDVRFSEKGLDEVVKKHIQRLDNVCSFYELYRGGESDRPFNPDNVSHVLDRWVCARLEELAITITTHLEMYEFDKASRPIADFIDDLSTWYIRRSRDRFKSENSTDRVQALTATRYVLREFATLIAPFMPFVAEDVYQKTKWSTDPESVHLAAWPHIPKVLSRDQKTLLERTQEVRRIISQALEARLRAGIKVRQPLATLYVKKDFAPEDIELIQDEVHVKQVRVNIHQTDTVILDTQINAELKLEGDMRELVRAIQDERKNAGLIPHDRAHAIIPDTVEYRTIIERYRQDILRVASLVDISFAQQDRVTITKV